ncbi:MAG: hypothetical protein H6622_14945 [Halobacteriovoraceae bacterium]|nr:hypothetical protein [Halobacteriovoraceae bacterium]
MNLFKKIENIKFKYFIPLSVGIFTVILSIILAVFLYNFYVNDFVKKEQNTLNTYFAANISLIEDYILKDKKSDLNSILMSIINIRNLDDVWIIDQKGKILFAFDKLIENQNLYDLKVINNIRRSTHETIVEFKNHTYYRQEDKIILGIYPLTISNDIGKLRPWKRGVVIVKHNISNKLTRARNKIIIIFSIVIICLFIFSTLLSLYLNKYITRKTENIIMIINRINDNDLICLDYSDCKNELSILSNEIINMGLNLESKNQKLKEIIQFREQFISNVSHEIRTPLNSIIGLNDVLLESPLDSEQKEYLNIMKNSGNNLLSLINNVLDLSKIDAGQMEIEKINFNITHNIEETIQSLRSQLNDKKIEVKLLSNIDRNTIVIGDPLRYRQIVVNILSNAIKFSETESKIDLILDQSIINSEEIIISLSIKDYGIGIPLEKRESIFQKFKQSDLSITRKYGGSGLGLSISKELSQKMHGDIFLICEDNPRSTTFKIQIPFKYFFLIK